MTYFINAKMRKDDHVVKTPKVTSRTSGPRRISDIIEELYPEIVKGKRDINCKKK